MMIVVGMKAVCGKGRVQLAAAGDHRADGPSGPGCLQSGPGCLQSGPGCLQSGPGCLQSGPGCLQSGPGDGERKGAACG